MRSRRPEAFCSCVASKFPTVLFCLPVRAFLSVGSFFFFFFLPFGAIRQGHQISTLWISPTPYPACLFFILPPSVTEIPDGGRGSRPCRRGRKSRPMNLTVLVRSSSKRHLERSIGVSAHVHLPLMACTNCDGKLNMMDMSYTQSTATVCCNYYLFIVILVRNDKQKTNLIRVMNL